MRKKILQLLLPVVAAAIAVTGCARCQTDTTYRVHTRNYNCPPAAVREPAIPEYPCGEVLVHEPTLRPKPELINSGDPDYEHYWVSAYWASMPEGWVYIPAHEEWSPGARRPVQTQTNSSPVLLEAAPM